MSSRQLRRLQQRRELEQSKHREAEEEGEADDDDDDEKFPQPAKQSLFAKLAALQGDDEEEAEEIEGLDEPDEKPTFVALNSDHQEQGW